MCLLVPHSCGRVESISLENGVENPDIPEGVDPKGHDPGVSFISVGDLAKAFYHAGMNMNKKKLTDKRASW